MSEATTDPDVVTLYVNGLKLTGWQDVTVTRGIEMMPGTFSLTVTEKYPTDPAAIPVNPGNTCVLKIGNDTVITGYIDRYSASISAENHTVRINGRGKCQDLVDNSAGITKSGSDGGFAMQINAANVLTLAKNLAAPFKITASQLTGSNGYTIPFTLINFGETPYEIIDRLSRYEGLLAYEGADGNLILSRAGSTDMASGFQIPGNVESAEVSFAMDQRHTDYYVLYTSTDTMGQEREATGRSNNGNLHGYSSDPSVPRFRPLAIVSEQTVDGVDIGSQRAIWEMNRRNGRSQTVSLVCDGWRDSAGALWQPNALAFLDLPILKIVNQKWLISEVTYQRSEDGTHANLTLMPKEAFSVEPTGLLGYDSQVGRDMSGGNPQQQI